MPGPTVGAMVTRKEPTIGELAIVLDEVRADVAEIKEQTRRTNGRVSEIEVSRRVEAALAEERAKLLAQEQDVRATTLATETARANARMSRRQWATNTVIGCVSAAAGAVGAATVLLAH